MSERHRTLENLLGIVFLHVSARRIQQATDKSIDKTFADTYGLLRDVTNYIIPTALMYKQTVQTSRMAPLLSLHFALYTYNRLALPCSFVQLPIYINNQCTSSSSLQVTVNNHLLTIFHQYQLQFSVTEIGFQLFILLVTPCSLLLNSFQTFSKLITRN